MNISASMVKELREKTGAGMMDCKKALVETNGDMEKAIKETRFFRMTIYFLIQNAATLFSHELGVI